MQKYLDEALNPARYPAGDRRVGPVQVGDTIMHAGKPHVVVSLDRRSGFGWPIADCADGWGIALQPDGRLEIPSPDPRWCVLATGRAA